MPKIKFENGQIVNFDGNPTPEDIDFVAKKLGITPSVQTGGLGNNIKSDLAKRGQEISQSFAGGASKNPIEGFNAGLNVLGQTAGGVLDVVNNVGKSAFNAGTNALSNVVSGTPSKPEQAIKKVGVDILQSPAGKLALGAIKEGVDTWNFFKQNHPQVAKDIENVINIGAVLPIAEGGLTVAKGATKLVKAGVEGVGTAVKEGVQPLGPALEGIGSKIQGSAPIFRPTASGAKQIIKEKAKTTLGGEIKSVLTNAKTSAMKTISDTANELGLAGMTEGRIGIQAERIRKSLWDDTIEPALQNVKKTLTKDEAFNMVANKIKQEADKTFSQGMLDALEAVKADYKNVKGWTAEQAQDLKASLTKRVPAKAYKGQDIAGNVANVRKMFSDELRAWIRKNIPSEVRTAYDHYGNLLTIIDRGASALSKSLWQGGSGKLVGQLISSGTTGIKTLGGKAITKVGELLK